MPLFARPHKPLLLRKYSTISSPTSVVKTPIGNTALWVAHCRSKECYRPDAIVKDTFAEILSGSEGKMIYDHYAKFLDKRANWWTKRILDGFDDGIVCRCKYYDDLALSKSQEHIKQIVILASGLDSRAFRLKWPSGVHVFEIDRKEVLDFKVNKLKQIQARPTCAQALLN
mmetsp:Transcript_25127/g.35203  ORF Transcript_25127/g.35203 Transcript_25127/m.35203 type:complete len:171 (-) Transcript_25127:12-524(-)